MDNSENNRISGDEMMALVRERLAAGQTVRYLPFRGVSMKPMLRQGKDSVELSSLPEQLQKYDIPVYQYPSGKYVMHRIVDVKPDHYVCMGDNLVEPEKIRREQMLGIVTAFCRGEKRIEVTAPGYRLYCRVWVGLFPVRKRWKRGKCFLRRLLK